jgi:hypothetical protein
MQQFLNINRKFVPQLFNNVVYLTTFRYLKKTIFYINDNTPPRLTSVAHLGGFSFNIGL